MGLYFHETSDVMKAFIATHLHFIVNFANTRNALNKMFPA